jgi:type II secretory pathway pseudopilin PulG
MEALVVAAVLIVLGALIYPVTTAMQQRANRAAAMNVMQQLAKAAAAYEAQNDNLLPAEGSKSNDSWQGCSDQSNGTAWFNTLPRNLGQRGVSDFVSDPKAFYSAQNLLYIAGAVYPPGEKRFARPFFAVAINSRLQRKDADTAKKVKLSQITKPDRTVLFFDQGLPDESKSVVTEEKYDGAPKGSARTFVGRYAGKGLLAFVDGHIELAAPKDMLTPTGRLVFPSEKYIWGRTPEDDPNKIAGQKGR